MNPKYLSSVSEELEEVLEKTNIGGLYWIRNSFIRTSQYSRIVLPKAGQGNFSVVFHGADFGNERHGGYEVYGIHVGQTDVLTFMACDERVMHGHFVDCRKGSASLHSHVSLDFRGDPDRSLVIERGIAHIFDNLEGMIALNQMKTYVDFRNIPDLNSGFDVINVSRGTEPSAFPVVQTSRFLSPKILCRFNRKVQRMRIRQGLGGNHSFNFQVDGKTFTMTPKS